MNDRPVTFRDAGIRSPALRALNAAGGLAERAGLAPRFDPDALLAEARKRTGLADTGGESFRPGLARACEAIEAEARLSTFGRLAVRGLLRNALETRLRLVDWAARHPEVRQERITAPFVILGLPRTGTTLLSFLLDLDPRNRSLLDWEARALVPPPELATRAEDPRIAAAAADEKRLEKLVPPLPAMHPMGATLPTECVTLFALDFRSLVIDSQVLVPSYGRWLEQADPAPAYAIHELALQVLQSAIPTGRWALKTPQHLWHLDALVDRYPDARLVWTHRDPARVMPSVASLNMAFYRTWSDHADPLATGVEWERKLRLALERGTAYDDAHEAGWCCHVAYAELMKDPVGTVRRIYAHFGEELDPLHARLVEAWMRQRPATHRGRHVYDPADFGWTAGELAERYRGYRERYGLVEEGA